MGSLAFVRQHPGYTIHPIRLSGSAVITLFNQLVVGTTNYSKGGVSGKYKGDDYQDAPLFALVEKRNFLVYD